MRRTRKRKKKDPKKSKRRAVNIFQGLPRRIDGKEAEDLDPEQPLPPLLQLIREVSENTTKE
jgi:hypothetical protein